MSAISNMTGNTPPRLGAQCLSCKKRRVKCDASKLSCTRCQKDGITCPGYMKKAQFKPYEPMSKQRYGNESNVSNKTMDNIRAVNSRCEDAEQTDILSCYLESQEDREDRLLVDLSYYYNEHMLPDMVPAQLPFRRADLQAADWTLPPPIVRNLLILLVKSSQAKRSGFERDTPSELCIYRGRSLNDLKNNVSEAAAEPYGIVLAAVIAYMGIDLRFSGLDGWDWTYHFKAARNIIELRGGFAKCFFDLPHSQDLLTRYMLLDVFTSTTCCVDELEIDSIRNQAKYGPITLLREKWLLERGHVCPQPLLQALIDTNTLRWKLQARNGSKLSTDSIRRHDDILLDIAHFDPCTWAGRVTRYGLAQPLRVDEIPDATVMEAWSTLASCYKEATMLYCMLSISAPTVNDDTQGIFTMQRLLAERLERLFGLAMPSPDGPIQSQLWKFCVWPAVVSMYVSICWCYTDVVEITRGLEQMHTTASVLGSDPLMKCWDMMSGIAVKRTHRMHAAWKWSDGFLSRRAFVAF